MKKRYSSRFIGPQVFWGSGSGFGPWQAVSILILLLGLTACTPDKSPSPVAGSGSELSAVIGDMADRLLENQGEPGTAIQVSPNNFWEKATFVNLPFSSILSDALAVALSRRGRTVTVQETGENPLKLAGTYGWAGPELHVVLSLRRMEQAASQDLAVVQGNVPRRRLNPDWFEPRFDRMARTLVRLLESEYSGFTSLTVAVRPFRPAHPGQPDLVLGREVAAYAADALASSYIFQAAGTGITRANAVLSGTYMTQGQQMRFHGTIRDRSSDEVLAGATFELPLENIPPDLFLPGIQSLDDLADGVSKDLLGQVAGTGRPQVVFIHRNGFHDTTAQAILPVSRILAEKFRDKISRMGAFTVTEDASMASDLIFTADLAKDVDGLTVSASLQQPGSQGGGTVFHTEAVARARLSSRFCKEPWFDFTLDGKIDFLMETLVRESLSSITGDGRAEVMIHPFRFKDTPYHSRFSDMLAVRMTDYFSGSRFFVPVRNVADRMARLKTGKARLLVVAPRTEATVAALVEAPYFIEGSFWPNLRGGVDIDASLVAVDGRILSSARAVIPGYLTDLDLVTPRMDDDAREKIDAVSAAPAIPGLGAQGQRTQGLRIELMTQKGRNNLSFRQGDEITFFVRTTRDAFLQIFTADATNRILRIFPNAFTGPDPHIRAGMVSAIPDDSYAGGFVFRVDPDAPTGQEMVFAVASDRPLPDLPGSRDTGFYGMTRQTMGIRDIRQWFSDYAAGRGIALSWDGLPVLTRP